MITRRDRKGIFGVESANDLWLLPRLLTPLAKEDNEDDHPSAESREPEHELDRGMWDVRDGICHNKLCTGDKISVRARCPPQEHGARYPLWTTDSSDYECRY